MVLFMTLSKEIIGLDCLKKLYKENEDFEEIWTSIQRDSMSKDFHISEGILVSYKSILHLADFLVGEADSKSVWRWT